MQKVPSAAKVRKLSSVACTSRYGKPELWTQVRAEVLHCAPFPQQTTLPSVRMPAKAKVEEATAAVWLAPQEGPVQCAGPSLNAPLTFLGAA